MKISILLLFTTLITIAEPLQVLFLAGPDSHAHGEHEHVAGCKLLARALETGGVDAQTKVLTGGWFSDKSVFDDVDVCVVYGDAGGPLWHNEPFIDEKVKEGMGLLFLHYGVHPKKEIGEEYHLKWTGAYFDNDISVNPHWAATLEPNVDHPTANGQPQNFCALDEFYYNMRTKDDCQLCTHGLTAVPEEKDFMRYNNIWHKAGGEGIGKRQTLLWLKDSENGSGRGAGFSGGHFHRNWAIDPFRRAVLNTIVWLGQREVPEDGVTLVEVTEEELNRDFAEGAETVELPTAALLDFEPMKRPLEREQ